jgi:hypothetical protein
MTAKPVFASPSDALKALRKDKLGCVYRSCDRKTGHITVYVVTAFGGWEGPASWWDRLLVEPSSAAA